MPVNELEGVVLGGLVTPLTENLNSVPAAKVLPNVKEA